MKRQEFLQVDPELQSQDAHVSFNLLKPNSLLSTSTLPSYLSLARDVKTMVIKKRWLKRLVLETGT